MVKLTVTMDGQVILARDMEPGSYSLGRLPENDLVLDHHEVSRRHARLLLSDSGVEVEDAGSTNGVLLDGHKVERAQVQSGQTITIKPYQLVFELPPPPAAPEADERTVIMETQEIASEATVIMAAPAWRLLVHGLPGGEREFTLPPGVTVLGRSAEADIQLEHSAVSRRHAQLEVTAQGVRLGDLGSKAGTLLNQAKTQEAQLRPGDRIGIGPFMLELAGGPEREAPYLAKIKQDSGTHKPAKVKKVKPQPAVDSGRRKRRLILLGASGVLLILIIMAIGQKGEEDKPASSPAAPAAQSASAPPAPAAASSPGQEQERREQAEKQRLALATLAKAQQALEASQYPEAVNLLKTVLALEPGQAEAQTLLARVQAIQAEEEQRQARLAREAQEQKKKIDELSRQAEEALAQERYPQAKDLARQLLELAPGHAEATAMLGKAQAALDRQEQEHKSARAAQENRANAARKHYDDGVRALQAGDRVTAVRAWKRVLESDPQGATPYAAKARAFLAENQPKLQAKAEPLYLQGQERLKAGDVAGAMAGFRAALREDPWHAAASKALQDSESRVARQVEDLYQEGLVLESLGDVAGATAKWRKALELTAPSSASHGRIKSKLDKYAR